MTWLNLQIAIFKEIYYFGRERYFDRIKKQDKERLKKKRLKHTFKAGKLEK